MSHLTCPATLVPSVPPSPQAQQAVAAAEAAAAAGPASLAVVSMQGAEAAAAAVRLGARAPLGGDAAGTIAAAASSPGAPAAAPSSSAPSRTRLVVFVVGVVGLGKTTLALALRDWLLLRAQGAGDAPEAGPPAAAALDQDEFAALGRDGSRAAVLARLQALLDEGVGVILLHRNGPGSAPLLATLAARAVPWAVLYPAELVCSERGSPPAAAVLAIARSLQARAEAAAMATAATAAPLAGGASLPSPPSSAAVPPAAPGHPLIDMPLARQVGSRCNGRRGVCRMRRAHPRLPSHCRPSFSAPSFPRCPRRSRRSARAPLPPFRCPTLSLHLLLPLLPTLLPSPSRSWRRTAS